MKRIAKIVAAAFGAVAMFAGSARADYTLERDEDWTVVGRPLSGTIDLAGHKLTVSSLTVETSPNLILDGAFEGVTIPALLNSGTWGYFNGGVTSPHWQTTDPDRVGFTKKGTTWTPWVNGSQAAFIQGDPVKDVTLLQEVQVPEDGKYLLTYSYSWRPASKAESHHLEVHVDDGPSCGSSDSSASVAVEEIVLELTAGSHTIKFIGTTRNDWATTILDDVSLRKMPPPNLVQDGTFEGVTIPTSVNSGNCGYFSDGVTIPHWQATVSDRVGFTKKNTTWTTWVNGSYAAFIQGDDRNGGTDVALQQEVQVPEDGKYLLTYSYSWRSGSASQAKSQHLEVHVDDGPVLGFTDSGASVEVKEIVLELTAGPHTIKFVGKTYNVWATTVLDDVSLRKIPEPPNLVQDGTFEGVTIPASLNSGTWGYFGDVTSPHWQTTDPNRVGFTKKGTTWTTWVNGSQAAFIQGDLAKDVTLQQEVQVTEGGKYRLTYSYCWRSGSANKATSQHLEVHVDDGPVLGFTDSGKSVEVKEIVLELTAGPHTIKFVGTTRDEWATTVLDDVSLRKVSADEVTITNTADAGYEILEYIDSDSKAYVDTGVTVADNTVIDIKLQLLRNPGETWVSYVGARDEGNRDGQLGGWFYGLKHHSGVTADEEQFGTVSLNTDYQVHLDKSGPCTINDEAPFATGNGVGNNYTITVFAMHQSTVKFGGFYRVYSCRIAYGNEVQRDLKPARRLSDGALGLLDVNAAIPEFYPNANTNANTTTGAFSAGPVVSDEFAHPAELHVAVASGETENSKVAITGPVRFVKEGVGTFIATKQGQTYNGGTDVKAGTFRCGECGNNRIYGADGSQVTVHEGATFDCDGWWGHYLHSFVLDGGTMKNSRDRATQREAWFDDVALTEDSFWVGRNYGFVGLGWTPSRLQMNGHLLTVDVDSSQYFFAGELTVEGGGEIYMRTGGWLTLGGMTAAGATTHDKYVKAETTTLRMGGAAINDLGGEHVFGSYVSESSGTWDGPNTVVKVLDRFEPKGTKWHATELQDDATLDLSDCTDTWNTTCKFAGSGNDATVAFAAGATINVDLGERTISAGEKVIGWTPETAPAKGVKFTSKLGKLRKMSDGAYYMQPFMIMIR